MPLDMTDYIEDGMISVKGFDYIECVFTMFIAIDN